MNTNSIVLHLHDIKINLNCNDLPLFKFLADQLQFPKFRDYANYINIKINVNVKYAAQEGERSDIFDTSKNNFSLNCWMKDINARIDKKTNSIYVQVLLPNALENEALLHLIIIEPLRYILKSKGIFLIHSAALMKDTKGLIICGEPGAGKTTLACTLLAKGYKFLSDEFSILKKGLIYSFPLKIKLEKLNFAQVKQLKDSPGDNIKSNPGASEFRPRKIAECFQPRLTLFIFKAHRMKNRIGIRPLSKEECFMFLVSDKNNSLSYEKNPILRKKQIQALSFIAQNSKSYALTYRLNNINQACQAIDRLI